MKNYLFKLRPFNRLRLKLTLTIFLPVFLVSELLVFSQHMHDPNKCGTWRWDIKTLTDKEGPALLTRKPIQTSFNQLVMEKPPKVLYDNNRSDGLLPRYPTEDLVVEIDAYVVKMKYEQDDHDLHLILRSVSSGETMVGEIPDPGCPTFNTFPELRNWFRKTREEGYKIWEELKKTHIPVKVRIIGVPFWDGTHSQRPSGASEYYREIHPVLRIITE
jgi:hypothetical protein